MNSTITKTILIIIGAMLTPQFINQLSVGINAFYRNRENTVSYPVLPIIEAEVNRLRPIIGGRLTKDTMDNICSLALGKQSTEKILEGLTNKKIDIESLKHSKGPESLLVNNNENARIILCASYLVNLPYSFPVVEILAKQGYMPDSNNNRNKLIDKNGQTFVFEGTKLAPELRLRMAVLQTNAEFFSLIAKSLTSNQGKKLKEYHNDARNIFIRMSGDYLSKVESRYETLKNGGLYLEKVSDNELLFSYGSLQYHKRINSTTLSLSGVLWYGNNSLLGNQYFVYATDIL
jgi:hypothetical protein